MFAHYAQATGLIEAIKEGKDVHTATAALIYHVPYTEVTDDQRSRAKTVNFALVYGQGDPALASALHITIAEAKSFRRQYFSDIPEAKPFLNTVMHVVKTRGWVKNKYGRRRHLTSDNAYKAPNALIQGCAADHIKSKMVMVDDYLDNYKSGLVNCVHDELIIEVLIEEVETVAPVIKSLVDDYTTFRVPLTCGCEFSLTNWGQKMDYDLNKSFDENKQAFIEKFGGV